MKVYGSNIYRNHTVQNVNNAKETDAVRRKSTQKDFPVPELDGSAKTTVSAKAAEDLNKILSAEEKQLFEKLFPTTGTSNGGPARAYRLQQNHNEHITRTEKKILGNLLDIRG